MKKTVIISLLLAFALTGCSGTTKSGQDVSTTAASSQPETSAAVASTAATSADETPAADNVSIANFYDCVDVIDETGESLGWDGEYMYLNPDGTGGMFLGEETEFPVRWTYDNNTVRVYDAEDDSDKGITGTYDNGIIRLDMGGGFYIIFSDDTTPEWKAWKEESDKFMKDYEDGQYDEPADTPDANDNDVTAPDGTGGIGETVLYASWGEWRSSDGDIISISEDRFTFERNGERSEGSVSFAEKDSLACLELKTESGNLQDGAYVWVDFDMPGRMQLFEDGGSKTFIYQADFAINSVTELPAANDYDGTPLTAPVCVDMQAKKQLRDVRLLKLKLTGVREDGFPFYEIASLLEVPSVDEGGYFSPTIEFTGDIPAYGISYTDEHGRERYFEFIMSGKDGTVSLNPFGR
ncbi:MAG: hypothetical protein ILP19_04360 [Oscillospiraceae bacterium]|nr:hypothetical protein [Oscillospiraceae bacterium]